MRSLVTVATMAAYSLSPLANAAPQNGKPTGATGAKDYIFQRAMAEIKADHQSVKPDRLRATIKPIMINADGVQDFVLDWEQFGSSAWCGTGGCRYQLWVGNAKGPPLLVFDRQMREMATRHVKGEIIFDFDFHGGICGTYGASACPASFAWDGKVGRLVERTTATGDGVIRLLEPVQDRAETAPPSVAARAVARKTLCTKAGGKIDPEMASLWWPISIPDIDGDSVRDWAFAGGYCQMPDDKPGFDGPRDIMATAGNAGQPVLALTDTSFDISVATKPASVETYVQVDDCEIYGTEADAKICPRTPMKWDAATGKLIAR